MSFKLISDFKPSGDQPEAIKQLIDGINRKEKFQTLLGVTGSGKTYTIANVIEKTGLPTLVMSHNKTLAAQLFAEFKTFFPNNKVEFFISYYDYYQPEAYLPVTDTYIAKDSSVNEEIDRLRLKATSALLSGDPNVIVVSSVSSIYGIGSPEEWNRQIVTIEKGEIIERNEFLRRILDIHYSRNDYELTRGSFRVRGDIVEVIPSSENEEAVRIQFFGDEIEKISIINKIDGSVITESDKETIYPNKHFLTSPEGLEKAITSINLELEERVDYFKAIGKYLEAQRISQRTKFDIEMLREVGYCQGVENYSRHLAGREPGSRPYCLFDYFPKNYLCVVDESHVTVPQIRGMQHGDRARKEVLVEHGFRLPSALDNRPLKFEEWEKIVNQVIFVSATPGDYEFKNSNGVFVEQVIRPTGLVDPEVKIRPIKNQIDDLINEIKIRVEKKERVLVTTLTKRMAEDLSEYLGDLNIKVSYIHSNIDALERVEILRNLRLGNCDVLVGVNLLREGLDLPEVSLVAILDADKEGFLRSERSLIQTAGRTARNENGVVILYADKKTDSIKKMLNESERRRKKQLAYNKKNKIIPKTILKSREDILASTSIADVKAGLDNKKIASFEKTQDSIYLKLSEDQKKDLIEEMEKEMIIASEALEFERAAHLRNEIERLKKL